MRWPLVFAGVSGAIAVALGAYAAHGMEGALGARAVALTETATRYMMWHALALIAVVLLRDRAISNGQAPSMFLKAAGYGFMLGIILFCGSLVALAFGAPSKLGAVTPIGGLSFIAGWIGLILAAPRGTSPP